VAIANTFGLAYLAKFEVISDELPAVA
jgi:hypothetical protein